VEKAPLYQLEEGAGHLEFAEPRGASHLEDRSMPVAGVPNRSELFGRIRAAGNRHRNVALGGDPLAEVLALVHPLHPLHEQVVRAHVVAHGDAGGVVAIEEVEHPVRHQQRGEGDLLGLLGHHLEELLARDEPERDGDLAETPPLGQRPFHGLDLLGRKNPQPIQKSPDALADDVRLGAEDGAPLEKQRS
jgi:hypothetical protein